MRARGSRQSWVTLQRPPPEIFTFCSSWDDFSRMRTLLLEFSAHVMAPKKPAAPPPITMRSYFMLIYKAF